MHRSIPLEKSLGDSDEGQIPETNWNRTDDVNGQED